MENSRQADPDDDTEDRPEPHHLAVEESDTVDRGRHGRNTQKILDDAEVRDHDASARDAASDERERAADAEAFANRDGAYHGHGEQRAAAHDRADSRTDRESSAEDRKQLTEGQDD